jgi:hypothetical protein
MSRVALLCACLVFACGKPPPPKAPPVEREANTVGDIAGRWVTSDDMDVGYSMTIDAAGTIDVWIDRGKGVRCEQKGTIAAKGRGAFVVTYTFGQCNPQAVRVPIDTKFKLSGELLNVTVAGEARTYQRAPDDGPKAERAPVPAQVQ